MLDKWVGGKGARYSDFVWQSVIRNAVFANFRRHRDYTRILEHLTAEEGQLHLSRIADARVRNICFASEFADTIGNPRTALFEGRQLSPTTLRYGKVADDILRMFPNFAAVRSICEIGVGYGGQARVLSELGAEIGGALTRFTLMDLPEVLMLAKKYLQHFHCRNEFVFQSITEVDPTAPGPDFVISNYAFSEFDRTLQQHYLDKVVLKCRSGYLTMNSGAPGADASNVYSQAELMKLLPNAKVVEEYPLTSANNYIILFGDHAA